MKRQVKVNENLIETLAELEHFKYLTFKYLDACKNAKINAETMIKINTQLSRLLAIADLAVSELQRGQLK